MAQTDTGLGWSAKEEWLSPQTIKLGNVGGGLDLPDGMKTVPELGYIVYTQYQQLINAGFIGWKNPSGDNRYIAIQPYEYDTYEIYSAAYQNDDGSGMVYLVSPKPFRVVRAYRLNGETADGFSELFYAPGGMIAEYSNTGLYYMKLVTGTGDWGNTQWTDCYYAGRLNSEEEFLEAIAKPSIPWYKYAGGFSVNCLYTRATENGELVSGACCISSIESYTALSNDGETVSEQYDTYSYPYNGMIFYMSIGEIQGDIISPEPDIPAVNLVPFSVFNTRKLFSTLVSGSFANVLLTTAPPDPYEEQSGASEEEGGDGDEIQNDEIDFTPPPTSMAVASGFITLFCPSQAELNALADYMWSPLFDVDTLKKLFANPMDCILGLSVIPVPIVPEGTKTVKVGGVSTTVSMGYTNHQYYLVDCGTVTIPKRWGAYMDYAPYTKLNIFLPYIGFRQISADDVMGKTLHLRYMIDILSGACNAELKVNNTVLYSWAGSCAMQIPITGNDWRSAITAGVSIAGSVAATVLSGGASAPMIAGTVASATVNSLALKPEVQRSGSLSSASGFLAAQRPYIVRTNPRSAIPANQNIYSGYPSFVTVSLGSIAGYNEIHSVHLENIPATGAELDEIETILKGGAIF